LYLSVDYLYFILCSTACFCLSFKNFTLQPCAAILSNKRFIHSQFTRSYILPNCWFTKHQTCHFAFNSSAGGKISTPRLGVYYFFVVHSVCLSICPSVSVTNIASFLFLDGIEPIFAHQFSMTKTTKLFSSIFDLGPLTPKIYSQNLYKIAYKSACMADRPEMFGPTRGFSGMADSMQPCKMWGRPLLPWQQHLA